MADYTTRTALLPSRRPKDDQGLNALRAQLLMQQAATQPTHINPGEPAAKAWAPLVSQLGAALAGKAAARQESEKTALADEKSRKLADMLSGLVQGKEVTTPGEMAPGPMPEGQMGPGALMPGPSTTSRVPYTEQEKLAQLAQFPETQGVVLQRMFPETAKEGDMPATVQQALWYAKQNPEMQATFDRLQRAPQLMNLGRTIGVLAPGGGLSQSYQVTPKLEQMPEFQAAVKAAETTAGATATNLAQGKDALGGALNDINKMRADISGLVKSPGFNKIYGLQGVVNPENYIPGTEAANSEARRNQLDAATFGLAIKNMRGLGALSDAEGKKVSAAYTRATNKKLSASEAKKAWEEVQNYLDIAEKSALQKAGMTKQDASPDSKIDPVEAELRRRGLIK